MGAEPSPYRPGDPELRSILGETRTIAVVGLSSNPERYSFEVASYLRSKGYRIVPVNPNETEVRVLVSLVGLGQLGTEPFRRSLGAVATSSRGFLGE